MNSKEEMKRLRNKVRKMVENMGIDFANTESLSYLTRRIVIVFDKWNPTTHDVLVKVYDTDKCISPKYDWISTSSKFALSKIWSLTNNMAIDIRRYVENW